GVEPRGYRTGRAGIDVNSVGPRQPAHDARRTAHLDVSPRGQVVAGTGGKVSLDLVADDFAGRSNELRQDRRVIARSTADMQHGAVLPRTQGAQQLAVQAGFAVVDPLFVGQSEEKVLIEVNRIVRGRLHVCFVIYGSRQPRPRAQETLPTDNCKRMLQAI